jgi:hypothetical protein
MKLFNISIHKKAPAVLKTTGAFYKADLKQ